MTAEIAIFNKSAIVLAADSAISIQGQGSQKIYNHAEKLFALTKHHPVGVMIYERNELQGVPWELIIKSYRKKLADNSFNTLKEYKNNFLEFVAEFYINLPKVVIETNLRQCFMDLVYNTIAQVLSLCESVDELTDGYLDRLYNSINSLLEQYKSLPYFDNINNDSLNLLPNDFNILATSEITKYIESNDIEENNESYINTCESFISLCKERLLRQDPFFNSITGIVFAGYGDKEYFPSLLECEIYGILDNKLKIIRNPCFSNTPISGLSTGLKAFAQKEEVHTFMQGIGQMTHDYFLKQLGSVTEFSENLIKKIINQYVPEEEREDIIKKSSELISNNLTSSKYNINQYCQKHHIDKVVSMIEHLPKSELAYMAESLVNLTAFKRKVSKEIDSVGGPIDVAVISKGDGFVWIKRKHYFPQELNQHYGPQK